MSVSLLHMELGGRSGAQYACKSKTIKFNKYIDCVISPVVFFPITSKSANQYMYFFFGMLTSVVYFHTEELN